MTTFLKAMVGLLLTLPVGAYFAGSYVSSHTDEPTDARLVRVDRDSAADRTVKPDPQPSPSPRSNRTTDEGAAEESDGADAEAWSTPDHSDDGDHGDRADDGDSGDHGDHGDDEHDGGHDGEDDGD
jgi:hypothetical protein